MMIKPHTLRIAGAFTAALALGVIVRFARRNGEAGGGMGVVGDHCANATIPNFTERLRWWMWDDGWDRISQSFQHDGRGNVVFVQYSPSTLQSKVMTMNPKNGKVLSKKTWAFPPKQKDTDPTKYLTAMSVASDGEYWYISTRTQMADSNFTLSKIDAHHNVVRSITISSYEPAAITYNSKDGTLILLGKTISHVFVYTTYLDFVRQVDNVVANEALTYDPVLDTYWAITYNPFYWDVKNLPPGILHRYDGNFDEMGAWILNSSVRSVAAIGSELVSLFTGCGEVAVFNLEPFHHDMNCSLCPKPSSNKGQNTAPAYGARVRFFMERRDGWFSPFAALQTMGPLDANDNFLVVMSGMDPKEHDADDEAHHVYAMSTDDGKVSKLPLTNSSVRPFGSIASAESSLVALMPSDHSLEQRLVRIEPLKGYIVSTLLYIDESISNVAFHSLSGNIIAATHNTQTSILHETTIAKLSHGEFVRTVGALPNYDSWFAWDPRLCSYWVCDGGLGIDRVDSSLRKLEPKVIRGEFDPVGIAGNEILARNVGWANSGQIDVYDISAGESDCLCQLHQDSACDGITKPMCKYDMRMATFEFSCAKDEEIAEIIRSSGYCGKCREYDLHPPEQIEILRNLTLDAEALFGITNDGQGNIIAYDMSGVVLKISPKDGSLIKTIRMRPRDANSERIFGIEMDSQILYTARRKAYNNDKTLLIKEDLKTKESQTIELDLPPDEYFGAMAFRRDRELLMILGQGHYYDDESAMHLYRAEDLESQENTNIVKLDALTSGRCGYWGSIRNLNLVFMLDDNMHVLRTISVVKEPFDVTVIENKLYVLHLEKDDWGNLLKSVVAVYDVGGMYGDCEDDKGEVRRNWKP